MRKYRGKLIDTEEWIVGALVKQHFLSGEKAFIIDHIYIVSDAGKPSEIRACIDYEVHPETVGQSTGETVTNGEVFVGDRMVDEDDSYLGVVKFGKLPLLKRGDCVCRYPAFYIDCQDSSYGEDCCEIGDWMKIIGTIHSEAE